eukprot:scaffold7624_cov248-Pinguiococcus_pyrenoidosus.AAC.18
MPSSKGASRAWSSISTPRVSCSAIRCPSSSFGAPLCCASALNTEAELPSPPAEAAWPPASAQLCAAARRPAGAAAPGAARWRRCAPAPSPRHGEVPSTHSCTRLRRRPFACAGEYAVQTARTEADRGGARRRSAPRRGEMVDYSKWDNLPSDSEDEAEGAADAQAPAAAAPVRVGRLAPRGTDGRIKFEFDGRTIYEWEQTLDDVSIYVVPPEGVQAKHISCEIQPRRLQLGLAGNPPFLDEETGGLVKADESYWMMADGELVITLQKGFKGETWDAALKGEVGLWSETSVARGASGNSLGQGGEQIDVATKQEVQKKLMLERFQEEHPG